MRDTCRIDGSQLIEVMDLGDQFVSDFVEDPMSGERSSLKVGIGGASGLLQLYESYSPEKLYRRYWYRSGINEAMVSELRDITLAAAKRVELAAGDVVLDIASNDGTLLGFWDKGLFRIGIDPAKNLKEFSSKNADVIVEDFFDSRHFFGNAPRKAKVITSIAMFYDLEDPNWFVEEVKKCLSEDGLWIIQMSYMPLMLEQNAFDNILAEHIEYYSFTVLRNLLAAHGLEVQDVELNDVNSGSFRVYIGHARNTTHRLPYHARQIGLYRVKSLIGYEKGLGLLEAAPYREFFDRIQEARRGTLELLGDLRARGKTVIGYGASTKGNTLLQFYGITPDLIPCIAERSPEKIGKKTVGTGIPIIGEEEARRRKPDYLFILPWHFVEAFKEREKALLDSGTRLIVPLPFPHILE